MDNIWVKRPSKGGISAKDFEAILGKRAKRYKNNIQLTWDDFE